MKKIVILDRDGVINLDSPDFIKSPEEWIPIPGSLEAIASLNKAGFEVAIATNQSGLARQYYDTATLDRIHQKMHTLLAEHGGKIHAVFFCPHGPDDTCECRKPKPGLIYQIADHFKITLSKEIPCIGDSLRDLEAAETAGCRPILVHTGNGQKTSEKLSPSLKTIAQYPDLSAAVNALLT